MTFGGRQPSVEDLGLLCGIISFGPFPMSEATKGIKDRDLSLAQVSPSLSLIHVIVDLDFNTRFLLQKVPHESGKLAFNTSRKPQNLKQVKWLWKRPVNWFPRCAGSEDKMLFEVKICIWERRPEPRWTLTDCPWHCWSQIGSSQPCCGGSLGQPPSILQIH